MMLINNTYFNNKIEFNNLIIFFMIVIFFGAIILTIRWDTENNLRIIRKNIIVITSEQF